MTAPNTSPPTAKTLTAETDLTRSRFCKRGTIANSVTAVTVAGEIAEAVVEEDVTVAEADGASVWFLNEGAIVPIEAAAAISLGALISASTNGRGQTQVTGQAILGVALQAASAAGHVIPMIPVKSSAVLGSTITDPSGGATVDAEARTAINALIDRLQDQGLIA